MRGTEFKYLKSEEIVVGDLCMIEEGDTFAADFILLGSSNNGICYIQTSSLDGEKNLKKRFRSKDIDKYILNSKEPERLIFIGELESEKPSAELYNYTGRI